MPLFPPSGLLTSSTTFGYTGGSQNFVVPAGVTSIAVEATGAEGGPSSGPIDQGGQGGTVRALIAVTPGETLHVEVGGKPAAAAGAGSPGGYNGGGVGYIDGGGGGGASDVRRTPYALGDRLIVGPGGGGSGANGAVSTPGQGDGLTPTGAAGSSGVGGPGGGGGGTQSAGGAGGSGASGTGSAGSLGSGGAGPNVGAGRNGGGGGGGYYGGGGGGTGGGGSSGGNGGGGSGYTSGTHAFAGWVPNTGHGSVTIYYPAFA